MSSSNHDTETQITIELIRATAQIVAGAAGAGEGKTAEKIEMLTRNVYLILEESVKVSRKKV